MWPAASIWARLCEPPLSPENKPNGQEIAHCRDFLRATIAAMPNLAAIVALGRIAHDTTAVALGRRVSSLKFGHGATHEVDTLTVFDSYHCSRYNTNTGVLTTEMFRTVFAAVRAYLEARSHAATAAALSSGGNTG